MRRCCLVCGRPDAHEHHTLPKSVWPEHRDNPDVLIPLCFYCHAAWHGGMAVAFWEILPEATQALIERSASEAWRAQWYPLRGNDTPF